MQSAPSQGPNKAKPGGHLSISNGKKGSQPRGRTPHPNSILDNQKAKARWGHAAPRANEGSHRHHTPLCPLHPKVVGSCPALSPVVGEAQKHSPQGRGDLATLGAEVALTKWLEASPTIRSQNLLRCSSAPN